MKTIKLKITTGTDTIINEVIFEDNELDLLNQFHHEVERLGQFKSEVQMTS